MPRYYFDVHDGFELRDEVGRDLSDHREMRMEAMNVIAGLSVAEGEDSDGYTIVLSVRDDAGDNVLTIRTVSQVDDRTKSRLRLVS